MGINDLKVYGNQKGNFMNKINKQTNYKNFLLTWPEINHTCTSEDGGHLPASDNVDCIHSVDAIRRSLSVCYWLVVYQGYDRWVIRLPKFQFVVEMDRWMISVIGERTLGRGKG